MNNGIWNKLKELVGKEVNLTSIDHGYTIYYPPYVRDSSMVILRIEDEDCVVLGGKDGEELFVSVDHISSLSIMKK
jgi:hypothetical protein